MNTWICMATILFSKRAQAFCSSLFRDTSAMGFVPSTFKANENVRSCLCCLGSPFISFTSRSITWQRASNTKSRLHLRPFSNPIGWGLIVNHFNLPFCPSLLPLPYNAGIPARIQCFRTIDVIRWASLGYQYPHHVSCAYAENLDRWHSGILQSYPVPLSVLVSAWAYQAPRKLLVLASLSHQAQSKQQALVVAACPDVLRIHDEPTATTIQG